MRLRSIPSFLVFAALAAYAQAPATAPMRGFAPDQWKAQHDLEEQAKTIPQAERLRIGAFLPIAGKIGCSGHVVTS